MTKESGLDSLQHQKCLSSPGKPTQAHQSTQPLLERVQGSLLPDESREYVKLNVHCTFYFKMYVHK
jgi:hypothetical protein